MKVTLDQDVCQGTGYCTKVCPSVFGFDDAIERAFVKVEEPDAALADQVEEAERLCPSGAIVVS